MSVPLFVSILSLCCVFKFSSVPCHLVVIASSIVPCLLCYVISASFQFRLLFLSFCILFPELKL